MEYEVRGEELQVAEEANEIEKRNSMQREWVSFST